ncbi:hypothetical protein [Clostridium sp. M14]|uniref:hypothetical protein n=1 Tax=Clostridium sp. M14 TaxID=2716311 RepID=UPI0013EEBD5A|nr:hypothetical protein [Clostridium sp. M14]MBZ9690625.1 hypothetical protein [Clostridium sp. M14]
MGLKGKFSGKFNKYFQDAYLEKYGDRITSTSGTVLSVKVFEKSYFIFHKILVEMVVKPEVGRSVVKCFYKQNKWFKKPEFITVSQGHKVIIMGVKGEKIKKKDTTEAIQIMNVLNLTTKKDLIPVDHSELKKSRQQATKMMRR